MKVSQSTYSGSSTFWNWEARPTTYNNARLSLPWMTHEIKRTIWKRDSLYDKYKRLRCPTDRCAFLQAKHLVKQKLKQAHNRYIEEILGLTNSLEQPESNCQSSPEPHKSTLASKKLFSLLKNSKQDSKGIAPLKKDGKLYSDTVDKANVLNQQFQSVFTPKCPLKLSQLASLAVQDLSDNGKYQVSVLILHPTWKVSLSQQMALSNSWRT